MKRNRKFKIMSNKDRSKLKVGDVVLIYFGAGTRKTAAKILSFTKIYKNYILMNKNGEEVYVSIGNLIKKLNKYKYPEYLL